MRLAEYPVRHPTVDMAARRHPGADLAARRRLMRAIYRDGLKFILADDGHREMYRISTDPRETENLIASEAATAEQMADLLRTFVTSLNHWEPEGPDPEVSPEQLERLKALGYIGAD